MSGSNEKEARDFNGTCSFGTAGAGSSDGGGVQLGNSMMSGSKKWIVEVQHPKYFSKETQWKNSVLVEKDEYDASIDALVVRFRHKIISYWGGGQSLSSIII